MDNTVDHPQRKRLRLQDYDYSQGNGYFVTIDVLDRRALFGQVNAGSVDLSKLGKQIAVTWAGLTDRYQGLLVDEWNVMPDHLHGILVFSSVDSTMQLPNLVDVISYFKSATTRMYHRYKEERGVADWPAQLWQRSYYERVIRSESDLDEKRNYIRSNPQRYELKRRGLL